jgi:hypothetical protein
MAGWLFCVACMWCVCGVLSSCVLVMPLMNGGSGRNGGSGSGRKAGLPRRGRDHFNFLSKSVLSMQLFAPKNNKLP